MVEELQVRMPLIAQLCRQYAVERLEVFGSASRGQTDDQVRDVDFIVRFQHPESPGYADRYLGLAEALENVLGRPVDLVTERSVRNPVFAAIISRDRQTIYAAA